MLDDRLIELISGSLDGVLSAEEASELEAALASTPEAREIQAQMSADKNGLKGLPALQVPANLKQRALLKSRAAQPSGGLSWTRGLMLAASLLVVAGLFWYNRPLATVSAKLHLRPGQLAGKAAEASHELHLAAAGSQHSHALVSDAVSGKFNGGHTRLHLKCDAGKSAGGRLLVTLAYDFDGDGTIDARHKPVVLEVDAQDGFQELTCDFPPENEMQDLHKGKVSVELACADEKSPPLNVRLEPEQARLELPFDSLQSNLPQGSTVEARDERLPGQPFTLGGVLFHDQADLGPLRGG